MNRVEELGRIENLEAVAWDLSNLLAVNNPDIAEEFAGSTARYAGSMEKALGNLQLAASQCEAGVHQRFIGFCGETAAGMAMLRVASASAVIDQEVVKAVDLNTPNLGIFVCNPYRGEGLGRDLALACCAEIDKKFDGKAWTAVKETNIASRRMVERAGFRPGPTLNNSVIYNYHALDLTA